MRLSIDKNDKAYAPEKHHQCMRSVVFLNGAEQKYCVTADTEEGMIVRYKTTIGANGRLQFVLDENRNTVLETVRGKVKIKEWNNK